MTPPDDHDISELLRRVRNSDEAAESQLMEKINNYLRHIAGQMMRNERADHSLQATELVMRPSCD